jgi:multidrug resistance efflux pump
MDLLLILMYVAFCYAVFKIFRIPVNQWSLATATLGGIVGLSLLLLVMNYNHPFSTNARIYFTVTPMIPAVKGRVVEVPVESNTPLKEGDELFRIDPKPYELTVQQKRAALAEAEQNVGGLKAAYDAAMAAATEATATRDRTKQAFDRYDQGNENARTANRNLPFSELDVENRRGVYLAADANLQAAQARAEQARIAFQSQIDGVNTVVARLRAERDEAQYDLEQTTVRAPGPGFVTQIALRSGMYVVPQPLRPVMVFVHDSAKDRVIGAAFQQNTLQRVRAGDDAEVLFDGIPGRVFKAKVRMVLDAIAAGQFQATGALQDFGVRGPGGRALALLDLQEDVSRYQLPLGSVGEAAIYTEHFHHVSMLRKILLRMRSWQNYIYIEGH